MLRKVLKMLGAGLTVILLAIAAFIVYSIIQTHKSLNMPRFADDYYNGFEAGGVLEEKYARKGNYTVKSIVAKSTSKSVKNIYMYYPEELETSEKQYPLIMIVNGSQTPAKTYLPFFERLATWGFVVVGNDDPQTGTGESTSITLDYVLNESEIRGRIDRNNIGIAGYSQGGAGAINAVTKYPNSDLYKTLFTGSAAYPLLAASQGWGYNPEEISLNYFMTASTGTSDDTGVKDINNEFGGVSPLSSLISIYNAIPDSLVKVRGRCVGAEHEDMLERTDGYMTAWMLWQLKEDQEASDVFVGDHAEIIDNARWQDIQKNK